MTRATRDRVWDAVPLRAEPSPGGEDHPLDLDHLDAATEAQVIARLLSRNFDAWSAAASRVGHCAKPIRLHGQSDTVDVKTGEISRRSPRRTPHWGCCMCGAGTVVRPSARPAHACTRPTRST